MQAGLGQQRNPERTTGEMSGSAAKGRIDTSEGIRQGAVIPQSV